MKVDLYTKTILTIIAACLIAIVFRGTPLIEPLQAHPEENVSYEEKDRAVWIAGWIDEEENHIHFSESPLPVRDR